MGYVLCCPTILIDFGDHNERRSFGDSLDGIPAGALQSLLQMNRACDEAELVQPVEVVEVDKVETLTVPAATDWRAVKVSTSQLPANILEALAEANLNTAGEVAEYGATHDGSLEDLRGIGKASDKAIQQWVASLVTAVEGGGS